MNGNPRIVQKSLMGADKGSALLLAMWAVAFVALAVIGVVAMVSTSQDQSIALMERFQARQIAQNAAVIATHPLVNEFDPILKGKSDLGGSYEVKLVSEGARLNINDILQKENREVLVQLFKSWGVRDGDAAIAIDSLLDWVDPDTFQRLNGAEQDYYRRANANSHFPSNRPFAMVDEMAFVRGMDAVIACNSNWKDAFTVWSEGGLDVNDASASLIAAVCGVSESRANELVEVRSRLKEVSDPKARRWKNLTEPLQILGLSPNQAKTVTPLLTVDSSIWRAESTGTVDDKSVVISVIFRKGSTQDNIVYRLEK